MNRMIIFVVGASRQGKTTFCKALADALNGVHTETDDVVRRAYERLTGCVIKESEQSAYQPDLNLLRNIMTSRCKSRLIEKILSDADIMISTAPLIIGGIRGRAEFYEALELAESAGYQLRSILIHRDFFTGDSGFELGPNDVQTVFTNQATQADLENLARQYALNGCPLQTDFLTNAASA